LCLPPERSLTGKAGRAHRPGGWSAVDLTADKGPHVFRRAGRGRRTGSWRATTWTTVCWSVTSARSATWSAG